MKSRTSTVPLEDAARDLVGAGCIALTYDEKLAQNGRLQLYLYPSHIVQAGTRPVSEPTAEQVRHILRDIDRVSLNDHEYPFWADIDNYGVSTVGKRALYFDESIASDSEHGFDEVTLQEGLATVADILSGGE